MYHIGRSYTEAKCWQACGDTGTLACCLGRAVCYLVKLSINMYLRLISSTPGSTALVNDQVLKETYTRRVVVALFVATRYWWQGKFVSGKEVSEKCWIYTKGYSAAVSSKPMTDTFSNVDRPGSEHIQFPFPYSLCTLLWDADLYGQR